MQYTFQSLLKNDNNKPFPLHSSNYMPNDYKHESFIYIPSFSVQNTFTTDQLTYGKDLRNPR